MEPLVSVVVITYNSSKFLLETLESIKAQNYSHIELIISDDCSTDNTLEICINWIKENKERFYRTELITVQKNAGIPANFNRGLNASHGVWLKFLAGDDLLNYSCISDNLDFIKARSDANVIISRYQTFSSPFHYSNFVNIRPPDDLIYFFDLTANQQLNIMRFRSEHLILGMFIRSVTLKSVNGFDERYKLFEDLPLLLNLLSTGNKFFYLPKITSYYRRNVNSVSSQNAKIYKLLLSEMFNAYCRLRRPYLSFIMKLHNDIYFINEYILVYCFNGKENTIFRVLKTGIMQLSPIHHQTRRDIKQGIIN